MNNPCHTKSYMKEEIEKLLNEACKDTGISKEWLKDRATLSGLKSLLSGGLTIKVDPLSENETPKEEAA